MIPFLLCLSRMLKLIIFGKLSLHQMQLTNGFIVIPHTTSI